MEFTSAHPFALPGIVLAMVMALVLMQPASRALGVAPWQSFLLLFSTGAVLAMTLTPGTSRSWHRTPVSEVEVVLNVLMFVPIGFVLALIPNARVRWLLGAIAVLTPFGIEAVQDLVPILNRYPRWIDVATNVAGVFLGIGLAAVLGRVRSRRRSSAV